MQLYKHLHTQQAIIQTTTHTHTTSMQLYKHLYTQANIEHAILHSYIAIPFRQSRFLWSHIYMKLGLG